MLADLRIDGDRILGHSPESLRRHRNGDSFLGGAKLPHPAHRRVRPWSATVACGIPLIVITKLESRLRCQAMGDWCNRHHGVCANRSGGDEYPSMSPSKRPSMRMRCPSICSIGIGSSSRFFRGVWGHFRRPNAPSLPVQIARCRSAQLPTATTVVRRRSARHGTILDGTGVRAIAAPTAHRTPPRTPTPDPDPLANDGTDVVVTGPHVRQHAAEYRQVDSAWLLRATIRLSRCWSPGCRGPIATSENALAKMGQPIKNRSE